MNEGYQFVVVVDRIHCWMDTTIGQHHSNDVDSMILVERHSTKQNETKNKTNALKQFNSNHTYRLNWDEHSTHSGLRLLYILKVWWSKKLSRLAASGHKKKVSFTIRNVYVMLSCNLIQLLIILINLPTKWLVSFDCGGSR